MGRDTGMRPGDMLGEVAETGCTGRCCAGGGWWSGKQAEFADVGAQRVDGSLIVGGDSRAMG